jgi:hypothetical protein
MTNQQRIAVVAWVSAVGLAGLVGLAFIALSSPSQPEVSQTLIPLAKVAQEAPQKQQRPIGVQQMPEPKKEDPWKAEGRFFSLAEVEEMERNRQEAEKRTGPRIQRKEEEED